MAAMTAPGVGQEVAIIRQLLAFQLGLPRQISEVENHHIGIHRHCLCLPHRILASAAGQITGQLLLQEINLSILHNGICLQLSVVREL